MSEDAPDLRATCQAFVVAAFAALTEERVLPTSVYSSYLAVGRDYFGDSIGSLAAFKALEAQLNERYAQRFDQPLKRRHGEFAQSYIFSFLEACIARCTRASNFTADGSAVEESISELLAVLETTTYEFVCVRHVAHLTTTSGEEIQLGEVTIVPEPDGFGHLRRRVQDEIPGARRAWNREDPRPYDPPHALLIIRNTTDDPDRHGVCNQLRVKLDRFLLLARLLTAGTAQSVYEVHGATTLVAPIDPVAYNASKGVFDTLVRRTVRLTGDEVSAFAALGEMLDAANIKRDGIVATSFDVALTKFNGSHATNSAYEHLVDLATAMEGALIGDNEGEGLTLRLCSRAAALLATDNDPATQVFNDVKQLYALRSKLVHGGQITEKDLRKIFRQVSTVPPDDAERYFGSALAYAVDRMRDLVRRAILARLCLAEDPEPLWPFTGGNPHTPIDAILADDQQRQAWRDHWHTRLAGLGAGDAARRPRAAVDSISQDDL